MVTLNELHHAMGHDRQLRLDRQEVGMSLFALMLHTWRLRRIRWAMRTATKRMLAYEALYGTLPFAEPVKAEV